MKPDLSGKRVTVMGLGRFGGGVGVTRWLVEQGCEVLVTDLDPEEKLADSLAAIGPLVDRGRVTLRLGGHNVADFTTCDLVIANVAVPKPWENRFLRAAEAAGIPITTEISLFLRAISGESRERTIAITGSAGKSTTTAMIHHAMERVSAPRGERVLIGGNIGISLLDQAAAIDARTWLVLELSSAMLYWIEREMGGSNGVGWSPRVAVVTNISANHLDWHGDMEHYARSKQSLIRSQRVGDVAVLGESVWSWRELTRATCVRIDRSSVPGPLSTPGLHNLDNAAAALAACRAAAPDVPTEEILSFLRGFSGLKHRLQRVESAGEKRALRFYNDSKSTTPESTLMAVAALAETPGIGAQRIHLIAGGYDKGADLTPIARAAGGLAGLYTIGKTGPGLAAAAGERAEECGTLKDATARALSRMRPGDVLLMSPGCASWDQYVNYEQRGEEFIRLVQESA